MTIYVSKDNQRYYEIKTWTYPSGEIHLPPAAVWDVKTARFVKLRLLTAYDCMEWLLLARHCPVKEIFLGYMPYARDDKYVEGSRTDTLKDMLELLWHTRKTYLVMDPHSDAVETNNNHITTFNSTKFYGEEEVVPTNVIVPDKGATDRSMSRYIQRHDMDKPLLLCDKLRNRDVQLTKLNFLPNKNQSYVIYDDICDGGGTFIAIAGELKKFEVKDVTLCITHGLFTNDALGRLLRTNVIREVRFLNSLHQKPDLPLSTVFVSNSLDEYSMPSISSFNPFSK